MYARKKVYWVEPGTDESFARRLKRAKATEEEREAMLKDLPLIEAARATDRTVTSLDDKVRRMFARACQGVAQLRSIVWVNPDRRAEDPIGWLERGAQPERQRTLGWSG